MKSDYEQGYDTACAKFVNERNALLKRAEVAEKERDEWRSLSAEIKLAGMEWMGRYDLLKARAKAAEARAEATEARLSDTEKRLEDALGEIEHLKDTRQDPYDFIEIWKRRAKIAEARVAELEAENARKVEYLKKLEEKIPGLNVDLAKANLKLAELEAASRWIPVSERLPEISKNVLLYDAWNNKVTNGELLRISFDDEAIQENIYEWATDGCYFHGGNFERITHWKFPQPPKQDEDIRHE